MADRKLPTAGMIPLILVPGLAGVYRVTQSPSFAAYRRIGVVGLVMAGAYAGILMVMVGFFLKRRRDDTPQSRRNWGIVALVGLFALNNIPRDVELYRAVDILQLSGSGVCFGVAIGLTAMMLRLRVSRA
jgi:hypothetical protein